MKGEVRNSMMVFLLSIATCGIYGLYWLYTVGNELKAYLGKEDINPMMDILIALVCFLYGYYVPIKYGKLIFEAQQKAGVPNPQDVGVKALLFNLLLCGFGYKVLQDELNKVWEAGGAGPATF
jgi:TRAP-type uncharacterized transport system fused permease subunit